jgi:hypothetical protein
MIRRLVSRCGIYVFGMCGLLLMLLVGKLAPYASPRQDTFPERARAWLARRGLDGIGAVGWLVDRLPPRVSSQRRSQSSPAIASIRERSNAKARKGTTDC